MKSVGRYQKISNKKFFYDIVYFIPIDSLITVIIQILQ